MEVVDLTEESQAPRRRPIADDRRGYVVLLDPALPQECRLRLCWSLSRPQMRHWHLDIRLADGRWFEGRSMSLLIPGGSS